MFSILKLFGQSPFVPLNSHMERVAGCVHLLKNLFQAIEEKNFSTAEELAKQISKKEHDADLTKNTIRKNLPKSIFLPLDRSQLLEILALQDSIADRAEDVAVLTTIKNLEILDAFKNEFNEFLNKNIDAFDKAFDVMAELHELLVSSFGGIEAQKVRTMVEQVAYKEHEADLIQRKLLKAILVAEDQMTYGTFHLWQKIFSSISEISNLAENLANRIRMSLELK